jgi:cell division topological specificity factor
MADLFWRLTQFIRRRKGSGLRARERLEVIVLCDRISLDRPALDALKAELTDVVARYVEVDRGAARLEVARDRSGVRLVAVFPVRRGGRAVGA